MRASDETMTAVLTAALRQDVQTLQESFQTMLNETEEIADLLMACTFWCGTLRGYIHEQDPEWPAWDAVPSLIGFDGQKKDLNILPAPMRLALWFVTAMIRGDEEMAVAHAAAAGELGQQEAFEFTRHVLSLVVGFMHSWTAA